MSNPNSADNWVGVIQKGITMKLSITRLRALLQTAIVLIALAAATTVAASEDRRVVAVAPGRLVDPARAGEVQRRARAHASGAS